ncbi:hypothetical protein BDN72DRAFT_237532 [Pluteus cervinus]|uniref:Uncharacterized protein n=1 Tax=Pluteus cervinus TaxID=181527 RepID=A0ACD3BFN3_9AGAR|nr:hypothetical protein BDN72DRAFT_237532 [Pluteus cervinus]
MSVNRQVVRFPPSGHKSHLNHLSVRSETWRRLENIHWFNESMLEQEIATWIDKNVPETPLGVQDSDDLTGERLSIPCAPWFHIAGNIERRPADIMRLAPWLDNLPLMTAQRMMHLVIPESQEWGFTLSHEDEVDKQIFQHFLWSRPIPEEELEEGRDRTEGSMIVAFQPPWILSDDDFTEFVNCKTFPPCYIYGNAFSTTLDSKERLWAKIWDLCVRRNTHWFVITTYNQWAFGVFSAGWTSVFISTIYPFDLHGPTILECLVYWVASAMHIPGAGELPQVPEPIAHRRPVLMHPTPVDIITPADSESNWDGKSDAIMTSAGAVGSISGAISDAGLPGLNAPIHRCAPFLEKVQDWVHDASPSYEIGPGAAKVERRCDRLITYPMTDNIGDWLVE